MEIKVANEAKQDTIINQGNQILNKINNQQITAKCIKSVQRGFVTKTQLYPNNRPTEIKIATVKIDNVSKCLLFAPYEKFGGNSTNATPVLKSDGIYLRALSGPFDGGLTTLGPLPWQVIEFY